VEVALDLGHFTYCTHMRSHGQWRMYCETQSYETSVEIKNFYEEHIKLCGAYLKDIIARGF
jgi:hypothetical protein